MKVLVLWEDPIERDEAETFANVLTSLSGTLCNARVDKNGGVTIDHARVGAFRKIAVAALDWRGLLDLATRKALRV